MANLNERQILGYLKERQQELTTELQRINSALEALTVAEPRKKRKYTRRAATPTSARKGKGGRPFRKKAVEVVTAATSRVAIPEPTGIGTRKRAAKKTSPAKNKSNNSLDDKIGATLRQIGPASKEEIIQHLSSQEPKSETTKLNRLVGMRLGSMLKSNKIQAVQDGSRSKYSIK